LNPSGQFFFPGPFELFGRTFGHLATPNITDDPTVHVSGIAKGRRKDDKSLAAKSRAGGSGQLAKRYLIKNIKNMCMCNK
jgi:hypothetical protein